MMGALLLTVAPVRGANDGAVVRGVFFYSPTCGHCHLVMTEVLPPLRERYGDQLAIVEIDIATPAGNALWQAAVTRYDPPVIGVPMLIVEDEVLLGSRDIPERLPGLIETHLAAGGVGWPDLPGLEDVVGDMGPAPAEEAGFLETLRERFVRDLAGNVLSVLVLIGLLVTLVAVIRPRHWQRSLAARVGAWGLVPILVGLVAAVYLAYVETTGTEAVCGPVGDCNTVQQSEYALLFGFLPVAVLGVIGYVAILAGYSLKLLLMRSQARSPQAGVRYLDATLFLMSLFGLVFSIFLTFLEPFVIGATCAWCLTSAVCMALVALMVAGPGWRALRETARELGLVQSRA